MDVGRYNRLVSFERATVTPNTLNEGVEAWEPLTMAWARVQWGSGQERREAAQEAGSQAATFEVRYSDELAAMNIKDRLILDGVAWDITSIAPVGLNKELHFTATRSV